MSSDKTLRISLLISAVFHTVIFLPLLSSFKAPPVKNDSPVIKVTYVQPKRTSIVKKRATPPPPPKKVEYRVKQHAIPKPGVTKAVKVEKKLVGLPAEPAKSGAQYAKIEIPPELPKEKESLYLDYYRSIREEISRFTLENYSRYIACGEVCLYFVLSADGRLQEIRVVEERSSPNRLLKDVARKSVQQAAPFLSFPEGLTQEQLSFNVIIAFEVETRQ
jgi:outer membrane biosynthesis protein TonB